MNKKVEYEHSGALVVVDNGLAICIYRHGYNIVTIIIILILTITLDRNDRIALLCGILLCCLLLVMRFVFPLLALCGAVFLNEWNRCV